MSRLLFGTSSWSEPSWKGVFYPSDLRPGAWLTHYATRFGVVEADTTYYRVPSTSLVRGWRDKTPEGFVVAAKFPRSIVHCGADERPDARRVLDVHHVGAELDRFLDAMRELGPRAGPLVIQLPYFNRSAFESVDPFLERLAAFLDRLPAEFRYGVEVRSRAWIGAPLLDLLRARRVALVLVDIAYMPHPEELTDRLDLVTTDFAYARLIGDRKAVEAVSTTFDRSVLDRKDRLEGWARLLAVLRKRVPTTYVLANNHYAGFAPGTIGELETMVDGPF